MKKKSLIMFFLPIFLIILTVSSCYKKEVQHTPTKAEKCKSVASSFPITVMGVMKL